MAADGSIIINVEFDNKQAQKELAALKRKIQQTEQTISTTEIARAEARNASVLKAAELDKEKLQLEDIKNKLLEIRAITRDKTVSPGDREAAKAQIPSLQEAYSEQAARVRMLQSEYNKIENSVDRYDQKLAKAQVDLDEQAKRAGELTEELNNAEGASNGIGEALERANQYMNRFVKRVIGLARRVFIFSLITSAFRSIREYIGNAIKSSDEATAALARLKAAFMTMLQPLIEAVIPALTVFINILTKIATVIAVILSALFGKTFQQSKEAAKGLNAEAKAIKGVGSAAEEAAGSLAGFDELNTINTEKGGGSSGSGGGASSGEIAPDFSWADGMEDIIERLQEVADLVLMIGAGLALWKIGTVLPGILGQIATILGGILLTLGGVLLYWNGLTDALENGVDWLNLIEMIGGLAAAALGLYILLGPIAAGIALVVGGLGMLVAGFRDAMKNGWNLENSLASIAGILAAGLGISLITGSWFPLLIAGIASVLLALTVATGHGEELISGVKTMLEGFIEFFSGVFKGDFEKTVEGISKIFKGLDAVVTSIMKAIEDSLLSFLNWLDEKTKGRFHGIIEMAKSFVVSTFEVLGTTIHNFIDGVKTVFIGIVEFISGVFTNDWDLALEGVKNIFKGNWNSIVSLLEGAINIIIRGLNFLITQMNKIKFDVPSWIPGVGGKKVGVNIPSISELRIPRLAQGAVIPPNREFMAVLGDQKRGTNIEAPLETIERALENVLSRSGDGNINITVELDGRVVARNTVRHINDMTRSAGKPVLLI